MFGEHSQDSLGGLPLDGTLPDVDGQSAPASVSTSGPFLLPGLTMTTTSNEEPNVDLSSPFRGDRAITSTLGAQRATITDEPCPNRPWLAVMPTVAPST